MTKIKYLFLFVLSVSVLVFSSCGEEEDPVDPNPTKYSEVATILNTSCAFSGCHDADATVGSLAGYADAKMFAEAGRMLGAINHETGFSPMPKNGAKMSSTNIDLLTEWVNDGLQE